MAIGLRAVDAAVHSAGADLTVTFGSSAFGWNQNDLAILVVKTAAQFTTLATPAGFVEETACRIKTSGTPGAAGEVGLQMFWKWATSDSGGSPNGLDANPVVAGVGLNHVVAQMYMFTLDSVGGIPPTATFSPFDAAAVATYASSTSGQAPGAITRNANAAVFSVTGNATDTTTEQGSGETNAALSGSGAAGFGQTTDGVGGGFDTMLGGAVAAGSFGAWSLTLATASKMAAFTICFLETEPQQGLHPVLQVSSTALGLTAGTGTLQYDPYNPSFNAAWSVVDDELASAALAFPDLRSIGLVDEELVVLDAPPITVDAAIASITATALGATSQAGAVTTTAALATITAAALAATDIPGSTTTAAAVAAITAAGLAATSVPGAVATAPAITSATATALGATSVPGSVTATADIAEATLTALDATATSENTVAADQADITSEALGATAVPGDVVVTAALATITAAALAAHEESGAVTVAGAVSAITAVGLGATAIPGAVAPAAGVAAITAEALPATPVAGAASNAAGISSIVVEALGATARNEGGIVVVTRKHPAATGQAGGGRRTIYLPQRATADQALMTLIALPATASSAAVARADIAYATAQALPATSHSEARVEAAAAWLVVDAMDASASSENVVAAALAGLVLVAEDAVAVAEGNVVDADYDVLVVKPAEARAIPGDVVARADIAYLMLIASGAELVTQDPRTP